MNDAQVKKKVAAELSKLKSKKGVYIFISKSENYQLVNQEVIRFLTKKNGYSGIYVTLNKTHCDIVKRLNSNKIDTKKLLFIDVSEGEKGCGAHNCIFIGNKSLTALSLAMSEACKQKTMQFLFFDSVTTLLIYEKLESVERFIHFILNKIKNLNILMIMMSVEEEKTKKIIPILGQFSDKCIRI